MLNAYPYKSNGFYSIYLRLSMLNVYDLLLFLTGKTRLNVIFIRYFIIFYKNIIYFYIFTEPVKIILILTARLLFLCRQGIYQMSQKAGID